MKFYRKRKIELNKELDSIAVEVDLSYAEDRVLGCKGRCPKCGASCERSFQCDPKLNIKHHTKYHRPMGYKEHEEVKSAIEVTADHCLSDKNLNDN